MIQLMRPSNFDDHVRDAFKTGIWLPKAVVVLSTPGEKQQVLLVRTGPKRRKPNEKSAWMPPQRQMNQDESVMDAGARILREEVNICDGVVPIRPLGCINRAFRHKRPDGCAEKVKGWLMVYTHFQIASTIKDLQPCDKDVVAASRFVAEREYLALIQTASPGKRQLSNIAVVTSGVFPSVPMAA
jgi:ADP-ribose pyrophosphatase YjhB (NUDIX family)